MYGGTKDSKFTGEKGVIFMHRYPLKITRQLTKEKAIELHRQLWNYIADESERTGKIVSKSDAFYHFGWGYNVQALCWCCQYCDFGCGKCPIEWPDGSCIATDTSLFNKWRYAKERIYMCLENDEVDYKKYLKRYIKYAREIANLPERKDTK